MDIIPFEILLDIYNFLDIESKKNLICNKHLTILQYLLFSEYNISYKYGYKISNNIFNQIRYLYNINKKFTILPSNIYKIQFSNNFNKSLDNIQFPESLKYIIFGNKFNKPFNNLPNKLIYLKLGKKFNQKIENIKLPDSIQYLIFGTNFNKSIDGFNLPISIIHLKFGNFFDKPINKLKIPPNLKHIEFGEKFNQKIDILKNYQITNLVFKSMRDIYGSVKLQYRTTFPDSLQYLKFGSFLDEYYENLNINLIPTKNLNYLSLWNINFSLEHFNNLTHFEWFFNDDYNYRHLQHIKLPKSLKYLFLGCCFNYSIEPLNLQLLDQLEHLKFGHSFNKKINKLNDNLKILEFGSTFNQKIYNLPKNLKILEFGKNYNRNINQMVLPDKLEILDLGKIFNKSLSNIKIPKTLRNIYINKKNCIIIKI